MVERDGMVARTAADEKRLNEQGYANGWEQYADELRRLDATMELWLRQRKLDMDDEAAEPFNGMFVSDEEFALLVRERPERDTRADPESAALRGKLAQLDARIAQRLARSAERDVFLPLPYLARLFRLSAFEERCVMLALAIELDRKYERLFGYMQDDLTRKHASVDVALQLLCRSAEERLAARAAFGKTGKLASYFLHKEEADAPAPAAKSLLAQPLVLDRRMTRFLLESGKPDAEMARYAAVYYPDEELPPLFVGQRLQERLRDYIADHYAAPAHDREGLFCYLWGHAGAGKKLHVRHICRHFNKPALIVDLARMLLEKRPFETMLGETFREAIMLQAVLVFERAEAVLAEERDRPDEAQQHEGEPRQSERLLRTFIEGVDAYGGLVFALAERFVKLARKPKRHLFVDVELPIPDEGERRALWRRFADGRRFAADVDLAVMGSKFRFTPGQIRKALALAQGLAGWEADAPGEDRGDSRAAERPPIDAATLHRACYAQVQHRLEKKATRIYPKYGWDDIVLPDEQKSQLRNACNQIVYRSVVYGDWGFDRKLAYGKGLSMLFAGPPGTGKTMSAQVIAKELQLEIYKIDLSQIISKYIGETEKNLHEVFTEAQLSNAILFFDETDALFGKRSEVKDSHDKYANIEIAYLLQKMEEYQGVSIMATNLLQNIDEAFMRRINYIIRFPFPDADYRERIWRSMFPPDAPVGPDVDYRLLAAKLEIAGGNIKNIAVSAAFLAADAKEAIGMRHLFVAAKHELQKTGKILVKEELGDY